MNILLRFLSIKIIYLATILLGLFSNNLKIKTSIILLKINNYWTLKNLQNNKSNKKILILLPHCLQNSNCIYKITHDINNCRLCGKCVISSFVQYSKNINSKNFKITVANGGTLARKSIKNFMPDIILAVACERDLTSGIFDAYPFFVYGIFNSRPNGDCIDTQVNFKEIEKFLKNFIYK
jgi:uncharacterized protein